MKKVNLLIFILFINLCSTTSNEGVASLTDTTTTSLVIAEEDYPIVLTQCLNEEKGYNIATPFDIQDLKTTISQLSNTKDEESQLGEDINYCINKYNQNLQLAKCLREKGINVSDPTQQEPKIDLSELDKSKEEISPLLKECGYGELGYEK